MPQLGVGRAGQLLSRQQIGAWRKAVGKGNTGKKRTEANKKLISDNYRVNKARTAGTLHSLRYEGPVTCIVGGRVKAFDKSTSTVLEMPCPWKGPSKS